MAVEKGRIVMKKKGYKIDWGLIIIGILLFPIMLLADLVKRNRYKGVIKASFLKENFLCFIKF
jgi:hypothetical protein